MFVWKECKIVEKVIFDTYLDLISISIFAKSTDTYSDKILSFGKGNRETRERADSIMHLVIEKATQYQNTVSKYEAEIYIKGRTEILKQNMLIRLAHHIFPIDRKIRICF